MRKRHLNNNSFYVVVAGLAAVAVSGCASFTATAPLGFAAVSGHDPFRAISPDGVVFRVRHEANQPKAELAFWKEALKNRLLAVGYTYVSEREVKASGRPGALLELAAPMGQVDFSYLVAIFVTAGDVVIVETAGPVLKLKERVPAVEAAIAALVLAY